LAIPAGLLQLPNDLWTPQSFISTLALLTIKDTLFVPLKYVNGLYHSFFQSPEHYVRTSQFEADSNISAVIFAYSSVQLPF